MYALSIVCSAGSDNRETAGELSRQQSPWRFGRASGDRRRCTSSSKSDLRPSFNPTPCVKIPRGIQNSSREEHNEYALARKDLVMLRDY